MNAGSAARPLVVGAAPRGPGNFTDVREIPGRPSRLAGPGEGATAGGRLVVHGALQREPLARGAAGLVGVAAAHAGLGHGADVGVAAAEEALELGVTEPDEADLGVAFAFLAELVAKAEQDAGGVLALAGGGEREAAVLVLPQALEAGVQEGVDVGGHLEVGVAAGDLEDALVTVAAGVVGGGPDALDEEDLGEDGPYQLPVEREGGGASSEAAS